MDPSEIVRSGYDAMSSRYLEARLRGIDELPLVREVCRLVPAGRLVLDAGCGAGVPLTKHLAESYRVLGVDFSLGQLRLASELAPMASYACQDIAHLAIARASVDAICSFYAIIHIPRSRHARLIRDLWDLLKPGGYALLCLGTEDIEEDLGTYQGVPMYWSHFDAEANVSMVSAIGFTIIRSLTVRDPIDEAGSHLFVLAQKPGFQQLRLGPPARQP